MRTLHCILNIFKIYFDTQRSASLQLRVKLTFIQSYKIWEKCKNYVCDFKNQVFVNLNSQFFDCLVPTYSFNNASHSTSTTDQPLSSFILFFRFH
jgi:hypothetical protein